MSGATIVAGAKPAAVVSVIGAPLEPPFEIAISLLLLNVPPSRQPVCPALKLVTSFTTDPNGLNWLPVPASDPPTAANFVQPDGAGAACTTTVGNDSAQADPAAFDLVTRARSMNPTSPCCTR